MTQPILTYFDFSGSRGEECRLALHVAGVAFTDRRVPRAEWPALKPTTPYGSMPLLDLPGKPTLAQSNAILVYVGREHGLHPSDNFEAARHEALLAYAEELRGIVAPVLRIAEDAAKLAARTELATKTIPAWAAFVERQLGDGPFVAGNKLHVADIKLYMIVRWFAKGGVDHVPATVFDAFPKLTRLYNAVADHPRIKDWVSRAS